MSKEKGAVYRHPEDEDGVLDDPKYNNCFWIFQGKEGVIIAKGNCSSAMNEYSNQSITT